MTAVTIIFTITASITAVCCVIGFLIAMAEIDGDGPLVFGAISLVATVIFGVAAVASYDDTPKPRRDYALYCVDGAAVVVNETYCEKELRPGAFWLWIGEPVTPVVPERSPAPPRGVLVDCTNEGVWGTLGLKIETADLPPNGTVRQADEGDLRELGVIR